MGFNEKRMQFLDILITVVLFVVACVLGKLCMNSFGETWLSFNVPSIGTVAVGELVWWIIRKRILKTIEVKANARNTRTSESNS